MGGNGKEKEVADESVGEEGMGKGKKWTLKEGREMARGKKKKKQWVMDEERWCVFLCVLYSWLVDT